MEPRAALIQSSFDLAHYLYEAVVQEYDSATAAFSMPGGMVPTPLAILAHAIGSEDMMISMMFEQPMVIAAAEFRDRTGIQQDHPGMTPEWHQSAFRLDGLRDYATAVFAQTKGLLATATPELLDREVPTPLGSTMTAAEFLASFGVVHFTEHVGELSALKGAQGMKGLPF